MYVPHACLVLVGARRGHPSDHPKLELHSHESVHVDAEDSLGSSVE